MAIEAERARTDGFDTMWSFLLMGGQKSDIPALKEHCESLRNTISTVSKRGFALNVAGLSVNNIRRLGQEEHRTIRASAISVPDVEQELTGRP